MRPVILSLDDSLSDQPKLTQFVAAEGGVEIDARLLGPQLRLWARPDVLALLRDRLVEELPSGALLVHIGSGDFHHVSALLVKRALETTGRPLTIVHVDNHPDWVKFANGLHCGSWVSAAARYPGVDRHITLGVCSSDIRQPWRKRADLGLLREDRLALYPLGGAKEPPCAMIAGVERPTMATFGKAGFIAHLLATIRTDDIYLTIDKDALDPADAVTNWDQGRLRLAYLERIILRLGEAFRIVGADICGDASHAVYGGGGMTRLLKRGEALIDQPNGVAPDAHAAIVNERTNLALFETILADAA